MIADDLNALLPNNWRCTHVIFLDGEWQVNATDDEHVVVGTGESIELALTRCYVNVECGNFTGRLFALNSAYREPATGKRRRLTLADIGYQPPQQPASNLRRL